MSLYNQYLNKETKQACSIVSLLQIMLYRYGILVYPNFLIKLAIYFDKLWKFSISSWATFSVIDNAFIYALNTKLKLKFRLETNTIPKLQESDKRTYQLWVLKYSTYKFRKAAEMWWWRITKEWIDYIMSFSWGWWHAMNYDLDWWWIAPDTDGRDNYKMDLETLKYWHKKGLFFTNIRTIEPNDEETTQVCNLTVRMFQAEKQDRLNEFIEMNQDNEYMAKAKELYFYGR